MFLLLFYSLDVDPWEKEAADELFKHRGSPSFQASNIRTFWKQFVGHSWFKFTPSQPKFARTKTPLPPNKIKRFWKHLHKSNVILLYIFYEN